MKSTTTTSSDRIVSLPGQDRSGSPANPIRDAIRHVITRWKRYRDRKILIRELARINDRLLRDIGIERDRIAEVAELIVERNSRRAAVQRLPRPVPASTEDVLERECA